MKEGLGWGIALWLIGYVLGIVLFMVVPLGLIGWVIMLIGSLITLWVLLKRIKNRSWRYYFYLGIIWMVIAVVCDYFFLVKLMKPADGYYKLDVYLYYFLTLMLPVLVGWYKKLFTK